MDLDVSNLTEITQQYMPRVLIALMVFVGFWLGGVITRRILARLALKLNSQRQDVLRILGQVSRVVLIIIGLISALGTLGVNVAAMVAGLGLTGFALSFALKDVLSNALAGVMLLFYQPFSRGQTIKVAGFSGIVDGIDLRYTVLDTENGKVLIPNAKLFTESVVILDTAVK